MPRIVRPFALLLLLALPATVARAGDSPWFARGKFGQAETDAAFGHPGLGRVVDDDDGSAAIELGHRFGPRLSLQAGYHDLGEYETRAIPCPLGVICPEILFEPATMEVTGVSLAVVPRLPLGERLSLFAKVGAIDWEAELVSDFSGRTIDTFDDVDLLAGAGVAYDLPSGLGFQLEIEGFDLDVLALTAGIGWRF